MHHDTLEGDGDLFATLRFGGARFDSANLPLDFLENIAAYQRILRELAVAIWREKNPERARLPRNFRARQSLSFSGVSDGSAKAKVVRDRYFQVGLPLNEHYIDYLALAQARFIQVSRAANDNRKVDDLPYTLRADLRKLVAGIRDDDLLNVVSATAIDQQNASVRYSKLTSERLIAALRVPKVMNLSGLAIVSGIDDLLQNLKLTSRHGILTVPIDRDRLRKEFSDSLNKIVQFSAKVHTGATGNLKVLEVTAVDLLRETNESRRLNDRVDELASLEDGWRDGEGRKLDRKMLHWARDIANYISAKYRGISAFPTPEGGLNFEFSDGNIEVTISVRPKVIQIDAFDDSDAEPKFQAFFAVTPKLLSHLDDLKDFIS